MNLQRGFAIINNDWLVHSLQHYNFHTSIFTSRCNFSRAPFTFQKNDDMKLLEVDKSNSEKCAQGDAKNLVLIST